MFADTLLREMRCFFSTRLALLMLLRYAIFHIIDIIDADTRA